MEKYILNILLPYLNHWGYYVLLLMTFLETSAFLGFLVPGESMVVIAGLLTSKGVLELGDVIWVASFGAIMGDTVGYFINGVIIIYLYFLFTKKRRLIKERIGWIDRKLSSLMPKTWRVCCWVCMACVLYCHGEYD